MAGFVQQQQIHSLQAELPKARFQAVAAVGSAEIPPDHAAAEDSASQRAKARCKLKRTPQPTLALGNGRWGEGLSEAALRGHREPAWMAAQQSTELGFNHAHAVEAGHIEVLNSQIHCDIQQPLAIA